MMMNDYVAAKLRQLNDERLSHTLIAARAEEASRIEKPRSKPVIGPALRFAGRTLRRVGAGIEDWADPAPCESDLGGLERRVG